MKLKEHLESKIEELKNQEFPRLEEYKFFEFLSKQISKSKYLEEVSNPDYLMALIVIEGKESFDNVYNAFETFSHCLDSGIFDTEIDEDIRRLLIVIDTFKAIGILDKILEIDHEPSHKELDKIIKECHIDEDSSEKNGKNSKIGLVDVVITYKIIGLDIFDDYDQLRSFTRCAKECDDIHDKFYDFINYRTYCATVREKLDKLKKSKDKDFFDEDYYEYEYGKDLFKRFFNEVDVSETLRKISERHFEVNKSKQQYKNIVNKEIKLYSKMLEIINLMEDNKIINIEKEVLSKLDDNELSIEFIKEVLEHNRKLYSILELENIRKGKYNKVEELFWENGIYLDNLDAQEKMLLIKNCNAESLYQVLKLLKDESLEWLNPQNKNYVQIVLNTKPEVLLEISKLIKKNVISKEFVSNNIGILLQESKIPVNKNDVEANNSLFIRNIKLLGQHINNLQGKLSKNESLILTDTETIMDNLSMSKRYLLDLDEQNTYGLNILNNDKLFDAVDSFIELGYSKYITENPNLLKDTSEEILIRLSIMTNIGLNPMNKEKKLKGMITTGKNFFVSNEELSEYKTKTIDEYVKNDDFEILKSHKRNSITVETEQLNIVEYLDNLFKTSDLEYQINDIIISRNKVLRNIECLMNNKEEYDEVSITLNSIIYNSVIDNNTIEYIKEKLNEYKDVKKKTYNI